MSNNKENHKVSPGQNSTPDRQVPTPTPDKRITRRGLLEQVAAGVLAAVVLTKFELSIVDLFGRAKKIAAQEGRIVWNEIMHRAPKVPPALRERFTISGNPIIIGLGDSVITGVEGISPVTIVTQELRSQDINAQSIIVAKPGSTADDIIIQDNLADTQLSKAGDRIVLVETGENDPFHDPEIRKLIEQFRNDPHNPVLSENLIRSQRRFLIDFKARYKNALKQILAKGNIDHLIIFGMLPVQWAKKIIHLNDQGLPDFSIQVEGDNLVQLVIANFIYEGTKTIMEIALELLNEGNSVSFVNTPEIISEADFRGNPDQHPNTNGYRKLAKAVIDLFSID